MTEISHHYADVNDVRLHYAAAGEGGLILFIHGFPEFWYAWRRQLVEFGRDHLAVAPDMRGYNLSSKPEAVDAYRIQHLVEDVRALADHLGYDRFTLVGHDWGGATAWAYALRYPQTLERLIIVNAPHPAIFQREMALNPLQQEASQYMLFFRSAGAEQALAADNYARMQKMVLGQGLARGYLDETDRQAYLQAWAQPGALSGGLNWYRAARVGPPGENQPMEEQLTEAVSQGYDDSMIVRVPTLVIWGEQDQALLTGNLEGLDEVVDDLSVRRIPDGSHWVIHEQPQEINRLIRAYLEGSVL